MSDNISFALAAGYNICKYTPSPVKDVLPYLLRRAENTSMAVRPYELSLIKAGIAVICGFSKLNKSPFIC